MKVTTFQIILASTLCSCASPGIQMQWPEIRDAEAIIKVGKTVDWNSDSVPIVMYSTGYGAAPEEIVRIDPIEVYVGKTYVLLVVQDDDALWRGIVVFLGPRSTSAFDKRFGAEAHVVDTSREDVKYIYVLGRSGNVPKPRFSLDRISANGDLRVAGFDGVKLMIGSEQQMGEVDVGRHSFFLTWANEDDRYYCSAAGWLDVDCVRGHYQLKVKQEGDQVVFYATNGSRSNIVAASKPIPLVRQSREEIEKMMDDFAKGFLVIPQ